MHRKPKRKKDAKGMIISTNGEMLGLCTRAFIRKVVAFSFFEPMSEKEAKRGGLKGLERREDMIRRNYFTGIRYVLRAQGKAKATIWYEMYVDRMQNLQLESDIVKH